MYVRTYTIRELAAAAGVTPRTIRYYTAEELLPPPDARGKYAVYGAEHLLRLRLIARLKEAYLPLAAIKERLEALTPAQVAELLGDAPAKAPPSAMEYVTQLLSAATPPHALAEQRASYDATPPRAALGPPAPRPAPAAPLRVGFAEAAADPDQQRLTPPAEQIDDEQRWRRITLAPGMELHIREPLPNERRQLVARLVAYAHGLLQETES